MTRTDSIRSSIEWCKRMRPVYPYDKRDSVLAAVLTAMLDEIERLEAAMSDEWKEQ